LIEEIKATTVVKCHPNSSITKLDITEKESKNKKQKMSNDEISASGLSHGGDGSVADVDCVVVADDEELMATDELEWICIFNISLKHSDREAIGNGRRLTDMHINAAQRILANQFPSFIGFDSTLKQRRVGKWVNNYIQILFCRGCHWITASTVGCREGVINVFDSLFDDLDDALKRALSEIFSENKLTFKMAAVPLQSGGSDCGVFAVAYATALALTQDPLHPMKFNQDGMRTHLIDCLQSKYFVDFP